jgi:hypothetical protein
MAHVQGTFTRRQFIQAAAAGSLALAGMGSSRVSWAQAVKPNIVFIMADDLGYADVSCYGQRDYTTPNVDRLAIEGLKFTQGYANSAVCSPTRTALITGRYQYRLAAGLEETINLQSPKNAGLPPDHPTLPSLLKKVGYATTLIGKWHLGFLPDFSPLKSGYDHFFGIWGGASDYFTSSTGATRPERSALFATATGSTCGSQATSSCLMSSRISASGPIIRSAKRMSSLDSKRTGTLGIVQFCRNGQLPRSTLTLANCWQIITVLRTQNRT